MDTPLPIPNREVKHLNADNSLCEDRKLPIFFGLKIAVKTQQLYWLIKILFDILKMVIEMQYKYTSKNEQDTIELAQNIESEKFPGMIICLDGELGSGKTVFVKGFAKAMGITDTITSPTFNLIKEYESNEGKLCHMDIYRLKDACETVGFDDYFNGDNISIIEWSDLICNCLPDERLDIKVKIIDENTRVFKITPHGEKYEELCESVL